MTGITVDLTANLARFTSTLDRATQDLNRFQSNTQRIAGNISSAFSGLGIGLSAVGFGALIKGSIDAADNLKDLSKSTGLTVENLAGLKLAANQSGTNLEDVAASINKLSVNIGKNGEKFRQLGIDAKDPLEAFAQLSDIFNQIEDPQQRAALAAAALGKSWQTTAPLLAEGGASIRQMISDGAAFSGVTTKMADQADQFNDQLELMKTRLGGLAVSIVGPVLDGFTQLADKINEASGEAASFNSVLKGIGNFAFDAEGVRGISVEIDNINEKIVQQRAKIKATSENGLVGGLIDSIAGNTLTRENLMLQTLLEDREKLIKKAQQKLNATLSAPAAASSAQINNFIGGGDSGGGNSSSRSIVPKLSKEDKLSQEDLAIYREFDDILSEGSLVALQQRNALRNVTEQAEKLKVELADLTPPASNEFEQRLYRIDDALKQGIFTSGEAKNAYDKLGQAFNNGVFDEGSQALEKLNSYADQAARNIQDSFAEFLFDPFKGGLDGMLESFINTIKQMVAQQASAALFGSKKDGGLGLGDLISDGVKSASTGISGFLAGLFHEGGIVGSGGSTIAVHPGVFTSAQRYHSGGLAGLKSDEVPAILQRGERVLSRQEVANGGGRAANITINFNGPAPTDRKAASQLAYQIGTEAERARKRNG